MTRLKPVRSPAGSRLYPGWRPVLRWTLNYASTDVRTAPKPLTGGQGADIVYDPVGGDLAEPVFRSIAWRGRYLVVGFAQGGIPALPWNLALLKEASVVGVFWGEFVKRASMQAANRSPRPWPSRC